MRHTRFLAALVVAAAATTASAQPRSWSAQPPTYVQLKLGLWSPQGSDLDGFDTGLGLGAVLGRRIDRNLAFEFGVGFYGTETAQFFGNDPQLGAYVGKTRLSIVPVTGALKLVFPGRVVEPYLEGGLGVYFARMTDEVTYASVGGADTSDSDAALGLHAGIGTTIALGPRASLLLEGRYHAARATLFDVSGRIDGLQLNGGVVFGF